MLWHRVEADFAVPWLVHINMDGGSCRWTGHLRLGVVRAVHVSSAIPSAWRPLADT